MPGTPVSLSIGTPGQNGSITFTGTAGHQLSMNFTGVTITDALEAGALRNFAPDDDDNE